MFFSVNVGNGERSSTNNGHQRPKSNPPPRPTIISDR